MIGRFAYGFTTKIFHVQWPLVRTNMISA